MMCPHSEARAHLVEAGLEQSGLHVLWENSLNIASKHELTSRTFHPPL